MTPILKEIYESASTDGYTHSGDGTFFTDLLGATMYAKTKYGNYAVKPIEYAAIERGDGRFG